MLTINFENIWKVYRPELLRFVKNRIKETDIAEDLVQNIFIKIYSNFNSLQSREKIRSWLYQIARNEIIDYYRAQKQPTLLFNDSQISTEETHNKVQQELSECLIPMINKLPSRYRESLILSEINGFTHQKIAQSTGISVSGSKTRVQRGRSQLKEMLSTCCQLELDPKGRLADYEQKEKTCEFCS